MIFKIKIFIEKNTKHFESRDPWTVNNPFNRENKSGIGKRIQIIAIKNKLKIFNFFLLRMKDYNFRLGSINCKFIGSRPHSQFLKLKICKVSKFKNACTFFKAVVSSAKRKLSRSLHILFLVDEICEIVKSWTNQSNEKLTWVFCIVNERNTHLVGGLNVLDRSKRSCTTSLSLKVTDNPTGNHTKRGHLGKDFIFKFSVTNSQGR